MEKSDQSYALIAILGPFALLAMQKLLLVGLIAYVALR